MQSIQEWLSGPTTSVATAPPTVQTQPQQVASVSVPTRILASRVGTDASSLGIYSSPKLWLQVASGGSASLPAEFDRLKRKGRDLLDGINGYIFDDGSRARLLIGPFRNQEEASIFADDLASVHIDAFTWTSKPGQAIRKLPSE